MAVVFPAPSGPITPNISPRATSSETASSAVTAPYFLVTFSKAIARHDWLCGSSASTGMPVFSTPSLLSAVTLMR